MGLHRIEFMTSDDNKPMRDFYDKFSIKFEGYKRECMVVPARNK
jgi:RimJ/RimL family protein N-acetyltransferase